jgi:hypothetical protein
MTRCTVVAFAAAFALLVGLTPGVVLGQVSTPPVADAAAVSVLAFDGAGATRVKGQVALSARLTTADGKPLTNQSVDFYQQVELFGPRLAYLGSATTDSSGAALVVVEPAEVGRQTIVVRFGGAEGYAASEASGSIEVATAVSPFEDEPLPLALVGEWLPYVLGAIVFATWVALLGVFSSTALGIRAAVPATQPSEQLVAATLSRRVGGDA